LNLKKKKVRHQPEKCSMEGKKGPQVTLRRGKKP